MAGTKPSGTTLIPVDMSGQRGSASEFYSGTFRVVIPLSQAIDHPIWKIVDDPARNRQVLAAMPLFYGTNLTDRPGKPAATSGAFAGSSLSGIAESRPFSPARRSVAARTFAMSSDTTVDWGRDFEHNWGEGDDRHISESSGATSFVRWLSEDSETSQQRLLHRNRQDHLPSGPGDPDHGERLSTPHDNRDEQLPASSPVYTARTSPSRAPGSAPAHALTPQPGDLAYHGTLPAPQPAELLTNAAATLHKFTLDVAAFDGNQLVAKASVDLQTIDDPAEFHDPRPDHAKLLELAKQTGGRARSRARPRKLADVLGRHPDGRPFAWWSTAGRSGTTPCSGCSFLGCLASEWMILRRRKDGSGLTECQATSLAASIPPSPTVPSL